LFNFTGAKHEEVVGSGEKGGIEGGAEGERIFYIYRWGEKGRLVKKGGGIHDTQVRKTQKGANEGKNRGGQNNS